MQVLLGEFKQNTTTRTKQELLTFLLMCLRGSAPRMTLGSMLLNHGRSDARSITMLYASVGRNVTLANTRPISLQSNQSCLLTPIAKFIPFYPLTIYFIHKILPYFTLPQENDCCPRCKVFTLPGCDATSAGLELHYKHYHTPKWIQRYISKPYLVWS